MSGNKLGIGLLTGFLAGVLFVTAITVENTFLYIIAVALSVTASIYIAIGVIAIGVTTGLAEHELHRRV